MCLIERSAPPEAGGPPAQQDSPHTLGVSGCLQAISGQAQSATPVTVNSNGEHLRQVSGKVLALSFPVGLAGNSHTRNNPSKKLQDS